MTFFKKKNQKSNHEEGAIINWNYLIGILLSKKITGVKVNSQYNFVGNNGTDEERYEWSSKVETIPSIKEYSRTYHDFIVLEKKDRGRDQYFPEQLIEEASKIVQDLKTDYPNANKQITSKLGKLELVLSKF